MTFQTEKGLVIPEFPLDEEFAEARIGLIFRTARGGEYSRNFLKGLEVLDIGSSYGLLGLWAGPSLHRFLTDCGASVTVVNDGLPMQETDGDPVLRIQEDVLEAVSGKGLDKIPQLEGREFGLITAMDFLGESMTPAIERKLSGLGIPRAVFEENFRLQAAKLLKEGGYMCLGASRSLSEPAIPVYEKKGGVLIRHPD